MASKVPAAAQTLQILALLSHIDVPISAARIQAELGLPRSTTYHLLTVMRDAGFVTYLPDTRTYGLGLAAYSMASAYTTQQPLVRATAKHARELAKLVGGSAHVGRLVGGEVVYLLEERSPRGVSLITDVGVRLPAAATASGRAMLAQLPAWWGTGRTGSGWYRSPRPNIVVGGRNPRRSAPVRKASRWRWWIIWAVRLPHWRSRFASAASIKTGSTR